MSCSSPDLQPLRPPVPPTLIAPVKITLSVRDGRLRVGSEPGARTVETTASGVRVVLPGGQAVEARFDPAGETFVARILEDAGEPVHVSIGSTLLHATQGDVLLAVAGPDHLDVWVQAGVLTVIGPDGRHAEVRQGGQLTVVGGAQGAVQGRRAEGPRPRARTRAPLRELRRDPILDRTDLVPAP